MTVAVYGMGRFGLFWAGELARRFDVVVSGRTRRDPPAGCRWVSPKEACAADVLVLTVAISAIDGVLAEVAPWLGPNTVVMDTCSVKVHPVEVMLRRLGSHRTIIATHPMFGPDSARNGVAGLPIVCWPVCGDGAVAAQWEAHFGAMGLRVIRMSPEDHDREAAYTQGVTHFVGRVLERIGLRESEIGTVGYRSLREIMTQTCNDPWGLFVDLQTYNPYTDAMRRRIRSAYDQVVEGLNGADASTVDRPS